MNEAMKIIDEVESKGGMTQCIVEGMPKLRIEASAAQKQAHIDSGMHTIVGVNKYQTQGEEQAYDVLKIDNVAVRKEQVAKINALKAKRNNDAVQEILKEIEVAAGDSSKGNLLTLSCEAARRRATLGEISLAIENAVGRHVANDGLVRGVYTTEYAGGKQTEILTTVAAKVKEFEEKAGRRPRMLVAKMGQDGHDRGAKVVSTGFADMGFDIDISPLFQTPAEVARAAVDSDVHVVGASSQAAGHRTLIPQLVEELKKADAKEIIVIAGGVIPQQDYQELYDSGVSLIFGPGTPIPQAADQLLDNMLKTVDANE